MKYTMTCPKCKSTNIVAPRPSIAPSGAAVWLKIPTGGLQSALLRPYICCNCGFSEYWITDPEELKALERYYKG